ncbi:MAG: bifunctional serine/threonine-protein kinase/formylglycine-generating enzyme family protein [Nostocaceae cyanobacterium]|nr:bifunctional serine/threonine-protein kinase/formylglycine-generating enzyme family protein [Nostocaceae cyanobacterium]
MLIGTRLRNRYHILRLLGSGGFGDTYLAEDLDLPGKPQCVVKHLKSQEINPAALPIARRLFESEAKVLYRLGSANNQIPRLFAHFEENGEFYLVQEFVQGTDLSSEIAVGKKLREQEVIRLLQEILTVLAVVHKQNIIHRDIKPQNIMRRQDGKIILIDFGAVKEIMTVNAQGQTSVSVTVGTPGYMPSEQGIGKPKLCSDVYAVGMLGIYALTGIQPHQLPTDPTNGEIIWRNWANVSDKLGDILTKMTRYHFSQRYHSAAEALQAITSLTPSVTPPPTVPIPTPQQTPQPHPPTPPTPKPQQTPQPPPPTPPTPKPQQTPQPPTPTPTPQTIPTDWTRRRIIKTAGFMGGGLITAFVGKEILQAFSGGNSQTGVTIPGTSSSTSLQTFNFETVTVDARGTITNRRNLSAKYFVEDLGNGVTLEMVQIPGGTFTMGSPAGEAQRDDNEGPQHQVTVPRFFMGRYEVTQAQYQAIMGKNPSGFTGKKRPVETVSWNDAVEFCKKLSQKTGRNYRLPSEAEWEYACRAGTTTPFYFGETITTDLVNYDGNSTYASAPNKGKHRKQTTDVGSFPPNAFGLYDMHGNVWEWCQDTYHQNYNGAPTDGSAWISENENRYHMLRGGSWDLNPILCRSAVRLNSYPGLIIDHVGFRVCLVVVG